MTREQALQFMAKFPEAHNFVKPSHLAIPSELYEAHLEAVRVRKDGFHALAGNTYMPRKETVDRFAQAAGVSFNAVRESTRREGEDCYVGTSQACVMGPDGRYSFSALCEYEFDAKVRHEEELLADLQAPYPKLHRNGALDPVRERMAYLALRKVARQRANTGARTRAVLSILGMQTGFRDLFAKEASSDATVTFLFSRIIANTKNALVLQAMLAQVAGPVGALYGDAAALAVRGTHAVPLLIEGGGHAAMSEAEGAGDEGDAGLRRMTTASGPEQEK